MLPELENINGTIKAAVIVGEISAIFCASSSEKLRQAGRSFWRGGVLMAVVLGIVVMGS